MEHSTVLPTEDSEVQLSTTNLEDLTPDSSRPNATAEVIVLSLIEVIIIFLSGFIILLIWTHENLRRNYTNWLVSNACAVVLAGALLHRWAYILTASQGGLWVLSDGYCHVMWISHSMFHINRPLSLLLITVTCAVFVYNPLNFSKKITKKVVWLMIGLSWLISCLYALLSTYGTGQPEITAPQRICHKINMTLRISSAIAEIVEYIVIFNVLIISTIIVFIYSWRLHRDSPQGDPDLTDERQKQAKQAAILTGLANSLYILMTLPLMITSIQTYLGKTTSGSADTRFAYAVNAAYDLVQLTLWMVLVPDVIDRLKSLSECCSDDKAERTRLL